MSEEEKQIWNERAAELMEAYKKELEAYNKNLAAEEEEAQKQGWLDVRIWCIVRGMFNWDCVEHNV